MLTIEIFLSYLITKHFSCVHIFTFKIQEEANKAHEMAVTSLEDTVRSLEQKCTDTEQNNVNLKKQVEELRKLEEEHAKLMKTGGCHKSTQTAFDSSLGRHDGKE